MNNLECESIDETDLTMIQLNNEEIEELNNSNITDFFISRNLFPEDVLVELETQSLSVNASPFKPSNNLTIKTESKLSTNALAFEPPYPTIPMPTPTTLMPNSWTFDHHTHMKALHSNIPATRISTTHSLKTKMSFMTTITHHSPPHLSLTSPTMNQSPLC